jgi:hypothetical protein
VGRHPRSILFSCSRSTAWALRRPPGKGPSGQVRRLFVPVPGRSMGLISLNASPPAHVPTRRKEKDESPKPRKPSITSLVPSPSFLNSSCKRCRSAINWQKSEQRCLIPDSCRPGVMAFTDGEGAAAGAAPNGQEQLGVRGAMSLQLPRALRGLSRVLPANQA